MEDYDIWFTVALWVGSISLACIGVILFFSAIFFLSKAEEFYALLENYYHCFNVHAVGAKDSLEKIVNTTSYLEGVELTLGELIDGRELVALESLKDTFLSRKDSEGLMLLEAVQKQLKKRKKKNEVPNNSTAV